MLPSPKLHRSLWPKKNFPPAWPALCTGRLRELSAPSLLSPLSDTWSCNLSISSPTLTATTFLHNHAPSRPTPHSLLTVCSCCLSGELPPILSFTRNIQHASPRSLHPWAHPLLLKLRALSSALSPPAIASFLPTVSLCLLP